MVMIDNPHAIRSMGCGLSMLPPLGVLPASSVDGQVGMRDSGMFSSLGHGQGCEISQAGRKL